MADRKLLKSEGQYDQVSFEKLEQQEVVIEKAYFEQCRFEHCDLSHAQLKNCQLIDCEFVNCNLSVLDVSGCRFSGVVFEQSKLIGVNWTQARWPAIHLNSPVTFYHCQLNHASFFGLKLAELVLEDCQLHEVDFREADLSSAVFASSDCSGAQFMKTNLTKADFTGARDYAIDPTLNKVTKAKFSFPEVVGLLHCFDIEWHQT